MPTTEALCQYPRYQVELMRRFDDKYAEGEIRFGRLELVSRVTAQPQRAVLLEGRCRLACWAHAGPTQTRSHGWVDTAVLLTEATKSWLCFPAEAGIGAEGRPAGPCLVNLFRQPSLVGWKVQDYHHSHPSLPWLQHRWSVLGFPPMGSKQVHR